VLRLCPCVASGTGDTPQVLVSAKSSSSSNSSSSGPIAWPPAATLRTLALEYAQGPAIVRRSQSKHATSGPVQFSLHTLTATVATRAVYVDPALYLE
jgi:hypothetical protein